MCKTPNLIDGMEIPCRLCDLCRSNRVSDLVGRCLAEQSVSKQTYAVTLTYAGYGPETAILRFRDVQLMLKRLRKAGYKVRYIVAGEYGARRGRSHWHCGLFFSGPKLPVEVFDPHIRKEDEIFCARYKDDPEGNINWEPYWPHGFAYFQRGAEAPFRYLMKYALKNELDGSSIRGLAMSKKPPLGYEFFMRMAWDAVQQALPIHAPSYSFSHVLDKDGKAKVFWLQNRMREMFLDRYFDLWAYTYSSDPPLTDFLCSDEDGGEYRYTAKKYKRIREVRDIEHGKDTLDLSYPDERILERSLFKTHGPFFRAVDRFTFRGIPAMSASFLGVQRWLEQLLPEFHYMIFLDSSQSGYIQFEKGERHWLSLEHDQLLRVLAREIPFPQELYLHQIPFDWLDQERAKLLMLDEAASFQRLQWY